MVVSVIEPILAGIAVSIINKYFLNNNSILWNWCSTQETVVVEQHEDTISSSNTTISDISFEPHVHCH